MENSTKKSNIFGSKKSKLSILPIAFAGLLAGGAVAGSVASIWHISKNHTDSADFSKSVTGRVRLDPLAGYSEDEKHGITETQVRESLQECAQKFSRWLKDRGQKSYDVSYELYTHNDVDPDHISDKYEAYLNANFEVDKVERKVITDKEQEGQKIDNDPYLSFFDEKGFNSNEKTLVYRWYTSTNTKTEPKYSIIPFRDLFNIPTKTQSDDNKSKSLVNKDGKSGVIFAVDDSKSSVHINDIYKNLVLAKNDNAKEEDQKPKSITEAWGQPRAYIVNDIQGLYDEINYHLSNWWSNKEDTDKYRNIYEGSNYASFSNDYREKAWDGESRDKSKDIYQQTYHLQSAHKYTDDDTNVEIPNADIFNYVDQQSAGKTEPNLSFISTHINEIMTYDELDKYMPKEINDDYKNDVEDEQNPKINYFWYETNSKNEADQYLNRQINYGFNKVSIMNMDFSDITIKGVDGADKTFERFKEQYRSTDIQPSFNETIFGGNNVVGVLSIGFLVFLLLLLILLAVLYRTTGIMSWICMLFALSMTLLISTISSMAISMSLIFGMFTMAIVGFMACLAICGRMKRRLNSHEDTQLMIKKTFKQSLLPILDISIITLIFGVCFTYISPIALNALGIVLITGAFATFISIYLFNAALHGLFFNNNYLVNKYEFFGHPTNRANELLLPNNNEIPMTLDATKLAFPYYSTMSTKRIDATNKKALIAVSVIGGILIIAIILFTVLGYVSATMFQTKACVAIKFEGDVFAQPWFTGLSYISYTHDVGSGWWYFNTNAGNAYEVAQAIASGSNLEFGKLVLVQNNYGLTNQDILNWALVSIIVATLTSAVYGAIRYNWLSFVPMLAGTFGMPLIILGLSAVLQVKFDQFVIMAFVFVTVINTIFCSNILSSISDSWSRKDPYNKPEFKYIVNTALTNGWGYMWQLAAAYLLFIVVFGITAPISASTLSMIGLFFIGFVVTMVFVPVTLSFLTFQFMKIRNIALTKLVARNKSKIVVDYDDIDEQNIEGINKFTKRIPIVVDSTPKGNSANNEK